MGETPVIFDPHVSIEGIATAVGVLGAAIGYVINLALNWRRDRRTRRYRGTRLVILDLLEQSLRTGLTVQELRAQYGSEAIAQQRKEYGAWDPGQLDDIEFERELKQLQLDFLIDLVGKDRYQIRVKLISSNDLREAAEARIASLTKSTVTTQELQDVASRILSKSTDRYIRRDALRVLLQLSDPKAVSEVVKALASTDDDLALDAAGLLAPYVTREG
jgi:hypothetical protein